MTKQALDTILTEIGYEDEEKKMAKETVGTLRRFKTITEKTLEKNKNLNSGMIDELMALKEWYLEWSASMESAANEVEEIFTTELWDEFLLKREEGAKQTREAKDNNGTEKVASKSDESLNISYKVETKEIPKLPPPTSL